MLIQIDTLGDLIVVISLRVGYWFACLYLLCALLVLFVLLCYTAGVLLGLLLFAC